MHATIFDFDLAADIAAGNGIALIELSRQHHVNPATAFRWVTKGLPAANGGRVKLEAIRRGKKWLTTAAAVARFFAALPQSAVVSHATPPRTPSKRERDCQRAKKTLNDRFRIS